MKLNGRPSGAVSRDALDEDTAYRVRQAFRRRCANRYSDIGAKVGMSAGQINNALQGDRTLRAAVAVRLLLAVCE